MQALMTTIQDDQKQANINETLNTPPKKRAPWGRWLRQEGSFLADQKQTAKRQEEREQKRNEN